MDIRLIFLNLVGAVITLGVTKKDSKAACWMVV